MTNFDKIIALAEKPRGRKKKRAKGRIKPRMSISKVQRLLWIECKRIIRAKYGNTCYTSGKTGLVGSDWHTGHFIPKGACGAFLKYDLRNLRPQSYHDNINLGGNGAEFYKRMVEREGQEYVDQLFRDKQKIINARDHFENLLEEYRLIHF